jgi:cobalt/nickel transport system permease protein
MAIVIQNLSSLLASYAVTVAIYVLAGLPKRRLLKWYSFPVFLVLSIAILFVFNEVGKTFGAVELLGFMIRVTDSGVLLLVKLLLRTLSIVTLSLTIVMTTKYSQLRYIVQKVLPYPLGHLFLLSYRFSFVIFTDASTTLKAIHARMGGLAKVFLRQSRLYGGIVALSLIYSVEKAERIGKAMEARGYTGDLRSYEAVKHPSVTGWAALLISISLFIVLYLFQGIIL